METHEKKIIRTVLGDISSEDLGFTLPHEHLLLDFSFMFKYSSRPGTKASEYTDQISEEVKQSRLERLIALQLENTLEQNHRSIGKTL